MHLLLTARTRGTGRSFCPRGEVPGAPYVRSKWHDDVPRMTPQPQHGSVKGLATVAMLKVNFDQGRDHLSMFEPMLLDTIAHLPKDDFDTDEARVSMAARHELSLPAATVGTLLSRIVRGGVLRREGGRYFKTSELDDVEDLRTSRTRMEGRQAHLARSLCEAAAERGLEVQSADEGLAMILRFLQDHHVALTFEVPPPQDHSEGAEDEDSETRLREVVTAAFLQQAIADGGELADVVQEMLEGLILRNVLLLRDIDSAQRRFQDLLVFLDSGLLFAALGLQGAANEVAATELFALLRDTGAHLNAFEQTIREMRRILTVYEERLGTHAGRLSLYPTELTRHFLSARSTPSDVRQVASLLETKIRSLGVNLRELPPREPQWTMDERLLARMLADGAGGIRRRASCMTSTA